MDQRRSRFEICIEIIELCQYPGLPITRLIHAANYSWGPLRRILFGLLRGELIEIETRPESFTGEKRKTDYYVRTLEGDEVLSKFNEIREQLTMSESQ